MRTIKTLDGISDGKLYSSYDTVAADADGCEGCSACCHGVGDLVSLTPFDIYNIKQALQCSFQALQQKYIHVIPEKGVMLPYLSEQGNNGACAFLDEARRCSIHVNRPNICRLFPLGRVYQEGTYKYFLQVDNCTKSNLKDVSIQEWVGIEAYEQHKTFILAWHQLLKALTFRLKFVREDLEKKEMINYILNCFYKADVPKGEDFYSYFFKILPEAKKYLGII